MLCTKYAEYQQVDILSEIVFLPTLHHCDEYPTVGTFKHQIVIVP